MEQKRNYDITDLYYEIARHENFEENASKILDSGIDINDKGIYTMTPLMFACYRGWLNQVQFLVENGADIQARGQDGENALFVSCMDKPSFVAFELMGNNEDDERNQKVCDVVSAERKRYKKQAIYLERKEIMKYLLEQGIAPTVLCDPYGLIRNASALDAYMANIYMNDLSIIDLLKNAGLPLRKNREDLYLQSEEMSLARKLSYYDRFK